MGRKEKHLCRSACKCLGDWVTSASRKASQVLLSREVACAIAADQCPSVVCLWLCCSAKPDGFRTPGLEQDMYQVAPEASSSGIA
ncbi:unnamed protein product [Urochloa humidicola]